MNRKGKIRQSFDSSKKKKSDLEKIDRKLKKESDIRLANKEIKKGRVLSIAPDAIVVQQGEDLYRCVLRGIMKKEVVRQNNLLAVGDFVLFEPKERCIIQVEPRQSVLSRLKGRKEQILAANIDQVLITVCVVSPPLKPALVDRYIIATVKGHMDPVIVVNKIDLLKEAGNEVRKHYETFLEVYGGLNIPIIPVSATTGIGIDRLKEQMKERTSVFSGQSGTGKSSLINAVAHLDLEVQEISESSQKGVHTTTCSQLIHLTDGGWCIDTPGIRSFGIWDLSAEDLAQYFPEITDLANGCKFPNCTHTHEPGCAVKHGQVHPMRFDSYQKLFEEIS